MNANEADETRALAAFLAALDTGASPADALSAEPDPARRARLAPLVATALSLRDASYGALRPAFRARVEGALAELERERARGGAGRVADGTRRVPPGIESHRSSSRVALRWAALVALAAGLTGLAYAAVRSGPGDVLQPLRAYVARLGAVRLGVDDAASAPHRTPPPASPTHVPRRSSAAASQLHRPGSEVPPIPQRAIRATATSTRPAAIDAASSPQSAATSPTPSPSAPSTPTTAAPSQPPDRPRPKTSSPTADHSPTAPSPTIPTGVAIQGTVSQAGAPQASMTVIAWQRPTDAGCAPGDLVQIATATTDAEGRYAFLGLPTGTYLLSAEAGAACLPRRWSGGAIELAVADPCGAAQLVLAREGDATGVGNVAFGGEVVGGCP